MKVSELTDGLLDYWVARAEGFQPAAAHGYSGDHLLFFPEGTLKDYPHADIAPGYSRDGKWGAPIIEREHISTLYMESLAEWRASHRLMRGSKSVGGDTCMQAAMRAHVAAKFGQDVPDDPLADFKAKP